MPSADAVRAVPYINLGAQYAAEKDDIHAIVDTIFSGGQFVGGAAIDDLEHELSQLCGVKHCITVNSGTDALILTLRAAGIGAGDEVITPPNSFYASTAVIVHVGARPVFADVLPDQNIDPARIEAAITPRTKAIMPVHLTGRVADMRPILEIAQRHGLAVIEDAAQAIGSSYDGKSAGSFGAFGCFSFHPLKNLNAAGDGGFVATNDAAAAARLKLLRNHGLKDRDTVVEWGYVSRLDTLQAAILSMRLKRLPSVIEARRRNAALYRARLSRDHVYHPPCRNIEFNTFHTFVVQVDRRDELSAWLKDRQIDTAVHYPCPIHLQPAAQNLGNKPGDFPVTERQATRILSLPIHQYLTEADVRTVADAINEFYESRQ